MIQKCSNQHVEISWDWASSLVLNCPICAMRREEEGKVYDEVEEIVEEKEEEIRKLEEIVEENEKTIGEKEETIRGLEHRIESSVLGQIDRLRKEVVQNEEMIREKEKEKEEIIMGNEEVIRKKEREFSALTNRVIPAHIPYEQYEKFLAEQRRRR